MTAVVTEATRAPAEPQRGRRGRLARRGGILVLLGAIAVGAVVAPGFDEREVTPDNPSVWAMQSVAGQRFGRVNTVIGEVDTVKEASAPTDIVQFRDSLLVYSDNFGTVTQVDTARPANLDDGGPQTGVSTPAGTDSMVHAGDYIAYLTDTGQVMAGRVSDGTALAPVQVDPFAATVVAEGEDRPEFRALAVAVSPTGQVAAYSAEQGAVVRANAATGVVEGTDSLAGGPSEGTLQMTWVGDTWVLYEPASGRLWHRGGTGPISTGAESPSRVQQPVATGGTISIADEFGVVQVSIADGAAARVFGATDVGLGEPAAPAQIPGTTTIVAAWLPAGINEGVMWESDGTTHQLDYGDEVLGDQRTPQFRSNGSRLILNESRSGWVWSVPSGELLPSSQQWDQDQDIPVTDPDNEVATEVSDPRAPVAEDDEFGVRAGRQVILPVLLNDHDANQDVLTVWPTLLGALDPAFGTLSVADDDQSLVVDVAPGATGSRTFTYVITDGTTSDGLLSEAATVTLDVKAPSINTAPEWCGVDDCLATWPAPQVAPGGTVSADVLNGWVDPEGDPIYLAGASTSSTAGVVAASPQGRIVFQHTNANATGSATAPIDVSVSDSWGATASKTLNVSILDEPELTATDLSLTVTAGVSTTVDVGNHVTGAVGSLQLAEASLEPGDDATVTVAQGVVGFTFFADDPGSHLVDFKVSDGTSETRGVARITVIPAEDERLATVPLTAFVRSKEDATVNVLRPISNPGGRVLLISGVTVAPAPGAQLSADVVGFSALRVSGETADAQPGPLGVVTYTVSDGTGRPEMTATGEVTVVLLGTDVPTAPVAVDDTITMRVGTLADVQVLSNDIGPTGNVIALDPGSVSNPGGSGLAFAAGSVIRFLAPNTPGTYVIPYSTYVLGYPAQRDTAQLVVTVLDSPTNSPPRPRELTGRVASGQSVRLAFDGTGIDPDGDKVTLQRVETQPSSGIASVSASGRAIIYTSEQGFSGQVSFTYSVVDARGQTATATATVGVIAAELEARPVTYADYVQAQAGENRAVVVEPTANDIDLAGGELSLVDISPDAPLGSDEYRELADRVLSVADGTVTLGVGTDPGTFTYLYTVRNATGSTAVGRIILKAVREPVADVPIVADTVLTLDKRESLLSGVDVLTGKVSWTSGDPAGLVLSLWGGPSDLKVNGWAISGPLSDAARIVPFTVTGVNFAGEQVTSYGFLRLPGLDDYRLALKEEVVAPQVTEGSSVTFDVAPLLAVPPGARLVIDPTDVSASGVRRGSTCELVSGTRIRYTAADDAPWTDLCRVAVRLADQDRFTLVPVPIIVIPKAPAPILRGASLEISPGQTATFDLAGMVSWPEGAAPRGVTFAWGYTGQQFLVEQSGTLLTITARDQSVPGNTDGATVSLSSDSDVPAVSLSLTVGPAPSALPKAGTVSHRCSEANGSSCTVTVIGSPGEVNPLPGTQLQVASVQPDPSCPGVTFTVSGTTAITAWWTPDTPGAVCNAIFTVRDAQGRVSAGDRVGTLSIDLQDLPDSPSEVRQTAFGDGSVTLAVSDNATTVSYPAITGYVIYEGAARVTTCGLDGTCPPITGLKNGVKHTYTAKAVNSIGESRTGVSVIAWSYAPPTAPGNVTWVPTASTGGEGKRVDIEVDVTDPTTRELRITSPNGETKVVTVSGDGRKSISGYFTGSNEPQTITITPATNLDLPSVTGAEELGAAVTFTANGVGKPTISKVEPTVNSGGTTVSLAVAVTLGGAGSETWVGVMNGGACQGMVAAADGSATVTTAVSPNVVNRLTVCAESRFSSVAYGAADTVETTVYPWADPGAPVLVTGYRVSHKCVGTGMTCSTSVAAPVFALTGLPDTVQVRFQFGADTTTTRRFAAMPVGAPVTIKAFQCIVFDSPPGQCSPTPLVVPADTGYAQYRTQVAVFPCVVGVAPSVAVGGASADWSAAWTLLDGSGNVASDYGAMRTAKVTVTFTGALAGIDPWTSDTSTCSGVPEPPPSPTPTPTPTPTVSPTP